MSDNYTGFGTIGQTQDDYSTTDFIARQITNGMATSTLVEVMAVNADTVDVRPMVNQIDGAGTGYPHGIIHGLPVHALRAGPCVIRITPRVGDIGHVSFCSSDISSVKATKKQANPGTRRRFDWSDGIYYGSVIPTADPTTIIEIDANNNVNITAPMTSITGDAEISGDVTATGSVTITGAIGTEAEYRVDGVRVVTAQQSAIDNPSGGGTIDAQGRVAIVSILSALRVHGLIA